MSVVGRKQCVGACCCCCWGGFSGWSSLSCDLNSQCSSTKSFQMIPVISFKAQLWVTWRWWDTAWSLMSQGQPKPVPPGLGWHLKGKHNSKLRKLRAGALWPSGFWRFEAVAAISPPDARTSSVVCLKWLLIRLFLFLGPFFSSLHCLSSSCWSRIPVIARKMPKKSVSTAEITPGFLA